VTGNAKTAIAMADTSIKHLIINWRSFG